MKLGNNAYLLTKRTISQFENHRSIGGYKFYYTGSNITVVQKNDQTILIYGRYVDSNDPNRTDEEIALDLVNSKNIEEILHLSKPLAGRYIILYASNNELTIIPDACATVKVVYTTLDEEFLLSSNAKLIAEICDYSESITSKKIAQSTLSYHPLPYDRTMYEEIKQLLPNHYFNASKREPVRFYPTKPITETDFDWAARKSVEMLHNIVQGFQSRSDLSIPITSGVDSRAVLALCKEFVNKTPLYTFKHRSYTEATADITIPKLMASQLNLEYALFNHPDVPLKALEIFKSKFGNHYNKNIMQNAWTYSNSHLRDRLYLTGDISPLAKSSFGMTLPECCATSNYLVTKTHNFSPENRKEVKRWYDDLFAFAKESGVSKFDLFFWEQRSGRNVADVFEQMDTLCEGISIFNCRNLIEIWLSVPRKYRNGNKLHKEIIKLAWPELLSFDINPTNKISARLLNNVLLKYIAVRGKFLLEKTLFHFKK